MTEFEIYLESLTNDKNYDSITVGDVFRKMSEDLQWIIKIIREVNAYDDILKVREEFRKLHRITNDLHEVASEMVYHPKKGG